MRPAPTADSAGARAQRQADWPPMRQAKGPRSPVGERACWFASQPSLARVTPAGSERTACGVSGSAAQVTSVTARGGVLGVGAEHAHQLGDHITATEFDYLGARGVGGGVLDDREVAVPE